MLDAAAKLTAAAYIGSRAGWVLRWAAQTGLASEQGVELLGVAPGAVTIRKDGAEETIACAALVLAPGRVAQAPHPA
ncbi:MAG: hypothetical protein ABIM50_15435 [Novosphingobium sp.]